MLLCIPRQHSRKATVGVVWFDCNAIRCKSMTKNQSLYNRDDQVYVDFKMHHTLRITISALTMTTSWNIIYADRLMESRTRSRPKYSSSAHSVMKSHTL